MMVTCGTIYRICAFLHSHFYPSQRRINDICHSAYFYLKPWRSRGSIEFCWSKVYIFLIIMHYFDDFWYLLWIFNSMNACTYLCSVALVWFLAFYNFDREQHCNTMQIQQWNHVDSKEGCMQLLLILIAYSNSVFRKVRMRTTSIARMVSLFILLLISTLVSANLCQKIFPQ